MVASKGAPWRACGWPCSVPGSESQVERRYRLRGKKRFQEVREQGRRWVHPLVVLGGLPNETGVTRCGFIVSHRMGDAVVRNRIRRRLREAVRLRYPRIRPGWDLVWVARPPIGQADFPAIAAAVEALLEQAGLWEAGEDSDA